MHDHIGMCAAGSVFFKEHLNCYGALHRGDEGGYILHMVYTHIHNEGESLWLFLVE